MPEHKIPFSSAPFFTRGSTSPEPAPAAFEAKDVGTTALVQKLQGQWDAAIAKKPEPSTDIWRVERDAEISKISSTLAAIEKQTTSAYRTMAESLKQQQDEQARQLRELFEQQAKQRPKRIRTSTGKVYEIES